MGTLANGVPLIELAIAEVTKEEAEAYALFRAEYEDLWRRFIDPAGIRFHADADRLRVEAHVLPLTNNQAYGSLRSMTGGKHTAADPARILMPAAGLRVALHHGGWLAFHLDDSPALPAWVARQMAALTYPEKAPPAAAPPPMTLIWGGDKGQREARGLANILDEILAKKPLFLRDKETTRTHRGVTLTRVPLSPPAYGSFIDLIDWVRKSDGSLSPLSLLPLMFPRDRPPAAFHTARIAEGWYTGLDEKALVSRIDAWKKGAREEGDPAAAGIVLSTRRPGMMAAAEMLLEAQARHKALTANVMWQALYDAGAVTPRMTDEQRAAVAMRLWGFVPAAPDGTAAEWDAGARRVRNVRHGTWDRPVVHLAPEARSPLAKFVRRFDTLGVDLRFREDGIHAVMTFGHVK
jgi:hypothetical protein